MFFHFYLGSYDFIITKDVILIMAHGAAGVVQPKLDGKQARAVSGVPATF